MSRRKCTDYFPRNADFPPSLVAEAVRCVRFEEVDSLKIVWHGHYAGYFEDGRAAFGEKFTLGYLDMFREQFLAPIVRMHVEYLHPLEFGDRFTVKTILHWSEAARLNFEYRIARSDGRDIARGYTVQILTDLDREALFVWPEYLENWRVRWKDGKLQ